MVIRDFWEKTVLEKRDSVFIYFKNKKYSYSDFDREINKFANGFSKRGIGEGIKVSLLFKNGLDYLKCLMSLQKIGAVAVPLIAGSTFREAEYVLNHSESEVLITDQEHLNTIYPNKDKLKYIKKIFLTDSINNNGEYENINKIIFNESPSNPKPIHINEHDPMGIFYTSGSTGKPKGVVLPQNSFTSCGMGMARRLAYNEKDVILCALPLFHVGGLHEAIAPAIACGGSVSLIEKFSASNFWDTVVDHKVTKALLLPTMMSILLSRPETKKEKQHSLNLVLSHVRSQEFIERFHVDIVTIWAMTELGGMGTLTRPGYNEYQPKLIGWPFPDDAMVKIIDHMGNEVPINTAGEIAFKHAATMTEYYKNIKETQKTIQNGWIRSGDIGRMDERGRVYFEGRIKNVIKRSGENISGEEIEFTIMSHPAVEECVVFGVADPIRTEEAVAVIVTRPDHKLSQQELVNWCSQKLSNWKIPRYIKIQANPLPKLANGKINRNMIKNSQNELLVWDKSTNEIINIQAIIK